MASTDGPAPHSAIVPVTILTVFRHSLAAATSVKLQRFMRERVMPTQQKTLRSVVATWRAALVWCAFGSTADKNTILLAFMRELREWTMRQHH